MSIADLQHSFEELKNDTTTAEGNDVVSVEEYDQHIVAAEMAIADVKNDIHVLEATAAGFQTVIAGLEAAKENGGMTHGEAVWATIAAENAGALVKMKFDTPALESFEEANGRLEMTTIATEDMKARVRKVWEATKEMMNKLIAKIKGFFKAVVQGKGRQVEAWDKLAKKAEETEGSVKESQLELSEAQAMALTDGGKLDLVKALGSLGGSEGVGFGVSLMESIESASKTAGEDKTFDVNEVAKAVLKGGKEEDGKIVHTKESKVGNYKTVVSLSSDDKGVLMGDVKVVSTAKDGEFKGGVKVSALDQKGIMDVAAAAKKALDAIDKAHEGGKAVEKNEKSVLKALEKASRDAEASKEENKVAAAMAKVKAMGTALTKTTSLTQQLASREYGTVKQSYAFAAACLKNIEAA